jgi:hypothetical protein
VKEFGSGFRRAFGHQKPGEKTEQQVEQIKIKP